MVEKRREEILQRVQLEYRDTLCNIIVEFKEVLLDKLPNGHRPKRDVKHHIKTIPGAKSPSRVLH